MRQLLAGIARLGSASHVGPGPALVVAVGHGGTHWIVATLYVLMPYIAEGLGLSYTQVGSILSLLQVSTFVANVGSGPVVDLTGRFVMAQIISLTIGGLALLALAASSGWAWLMLPVALSGITISLWHPAAITYLSRRYPEARGLALSVHTLGATLGDMLAPVTVGLLLLALSWQGAALVTALPLFAFAAAIVFMLEESDVPRTERSSGAAGLGEYARGLGVMLRNRSVIKVCVMAGLRSMTQNGLMVFIPLYLVGALAVSPAAVGIAMMALQAGGMVAGPLAGAWSDRVGRRPVVMAGMAATTALILVLTFTGGVVPFIAVVAMIGFALFAVRPVIHSWTMDLAEEGTSGSAVSLLFAAQSAFSALVPLVGGMIADVWGLATVFYALTVTGAVATAMLLIMPNSRAAAPAAAE